MKIFLGGCWDPYKAKWYQDEGRELGEILGERGHDIVVGPASGIVKYVLEGFLPQKNRGKVIFYLPDKRDMVRSGEDLGDFADEVVDVPGHYIERMYRIALDTDAFIAIGGAAGTFYEMTTMTFLKKPVAILQDTGGASLAAAFMGGLRDYYHRGVTPKGMVDYVESATITTNVPSEGVEWYDEVNL